MSDKPSYLGLLNAVSLAESRAHCYLTAWIEVCPNPDVRQVLSTVAAREGEHGMTFAKRINELGYQLRPKDDPGFQERMEIARSDRSDLDKMELLGFSRLDTGDRPDIFDSFFHDHSLDIRTGELLGRYIAEERDSARLLHHCYSLLCEAAGRPIEQHGQTSTNDRLTAIEDKVDAVCRAIGELRQIVCAQSMAPENSN